MENLSRHWSPLLVYEYILNFDTKINSKLHLMWFRHNWFQSIYYAIIYAICIYFGSKFMKNRKPFSLRIPLIIWSSFLGIFSIMGSLHCLPEFMDTITKKGLVESFCSISYVEDNRVLFWHLLFGQSKLIEFGDTIRKHVIHNCSKAETNQISLVSSYVGSYCMLFWSFGLMRCPTMVCQYYITNVHKFVSKILFLGCNQFFGSFYNVFIFRFESYEIQNYNYNIKIDNISTNTSYDNWINSNVSYCKHKT